MYYGTSCFICPRLKVAIKSFKSPSFVAEIKTEKYIPIALWAVGGSRHKLYESIKTELRLEIENNKQKQ